MNSNRIRPILSAVLSILLALMCLYIPAIPLPASAANAVLSMERVSGAPGETVGVPILIENCDGWSGGGMRLYFDTRMTLADLDSDPDTHTFWSQGSAALNAVLMGSVHPDGYCCSLTLAASQDQTADGEIAVIYFQIPSDAAEGTYYYLSLQVDSFFNASYADVPVSVSDGAVIAETIQETTTTTETTTSTTTTTTTTSTTTTTTTTSSTTTTTTTSTTTTTTTTSTTTTTTTTSPTTTTTTTSSTTTTTTTSPTTTTTTTSSTTTTTTTTIPVQTHLRGDVNLDGEIDTNDAVLVLKSNACEMIGQPSPLSEEQYALGDINGKDGCTTDDAVLILRYYAMNMIGRVTWEELLDEIQTPTDL